MTRLQDREKFERLARRIEPDQKALGTWELKDGDSAHVTSREIERGDCTGFAG